MSRATRNWLITAGVLIVVGCAVVAGALAGLDGDLTRLQTAPFETNRHDVTQEFHTVSLDVDTADVSFVASQGSACAVECYEQSNMTHRVAVEDGTLIVETVDTREWYEHIGISWETPRITVYLPADSCAALRIEGSTGNVALADGLTFDRVDVDLSTGDVRCGADVTGEVRVTASTGDVRIEGTSAALLTVSVSTGRVSVSDVRCEGDLSVNVSTGEVELTDVRCSSVISTGNTGSITLKDVLAADRFSIERSTGDVTFDGADAAELQIETDTGDVKGSLLTDKVFITRTNTGSIHVPSTTAGGVCRITTDTGDIRITLR